MSDKAKQKLWDALFVIMILLLLLGFCGAMIMNRMEFAGRPFSPEWKTALVVFEIIVLVIAAVLFRLMPKKYTAKKKDYSEMTDAEMFAINKAAMDEFLKGGTDKRTR